MIDLDVTLLQPALGVDSRLAAVTCSRDCLSVSVVVLPEANHYVQEDAPDQIAEAVRGRFG